MSVVAAFTRLDAATDGQLLGRFVQSRDADAFAALVRRLGPTVLAVCRRVCPDAHLAEDAFQAAFLVLATKANAIRPREQVAVWLHGVAYRTASKARAMLASHRRREADSPALPDTPIPDAHIPDDDELRKLDAAIAALPEHLRAAVVLCELDGRSRKEAAKQLGVPEGTLSSRLAEARKRLGERLRPAVAVVTVALAARTAEAVVGGSTSETVRSLARGVISTMLLNKLKAPVVALLVIVATVTGLTVASFSPTPRADAAPVPKEKERTTPFVEWKYTEPSRELTSPILCGDKVVVGTGGGVLRAFRGRDGEAVWEYKHGKRIYHKPSTDGERVFFTSADGVTAVTADKGEEIWRFNVKQGDGPSLVDAKLGLVYAGGEDGQLYTLDAKSGEEKWKADFVKDAPPDRPGFPGADARIQNTLARPDGLASDGKLLVLSVFDQSRVVAFDPKTGKHLWSYQADGWTSRAAVVTPSVVLTGSQDQHLHALNRETGKPEWKFKTDGRTDSTPTADDAAGYCVSSDGRLYAVGMKDGKKLWQFEPDPQADERAKGIYSTPLLVRDTLHFATKEGQFYAVDKRSGELRWKLRPVEHSLVYSAAVTDGTRFFLTTSPKMEISGQPPPNPPGEAALVAVRLK